ncbi:MAG: helix-turn-helix domain-containing protein [Prevotellaceae bacterium]|jgi:plasmid maintenance system antidote protein VapI|nr:helix-turn-helix domain-containing protein [Prevotellaceae bacterium]
MNNRIVKLIKAEGLTNSKFASILGIQRSNVTHIVDERNKPSLSFIEKLISKFPNVNVEWLMTGMGEMYKQNEVTVQNTAQNIVQETPKTEQKDDSPTLFTIIPPQTSDNQTKNNQPVSQGIGQEIEVKSEMKSDDKRQNQNQDSEDLKQLTPPESDSVRKNDEREIECVLIFHSDKTFKYYRPEY